MFPFTESLIHPGTCLSCSILCTIMKYWIERLEQKNHYLYYQCESFRRASKKILFYNNIQKKNRQNSVHLLRLEPNVRNTVDSLYDGYGLKRTASISRTSFFGADWCRLKVKSHIKRVSLKQTSLTSTS